ncbi:MAG TPA: SDR family NAD(P)-dependent oxidoreductase [Acidimicrobiia bacterium]
MSSDPDRVAIVTGAATGIGAATASALGEAGYRVFLVDIDGELGPTVAEQSPGATFVHCDVTSERSIHRAAATIEADVDHVDVLVNNAGGFGEAKGIEETSLEEWTEIIDANLTSVFLMTKATLPLIRRSGAGRIVNLGSLAGQTAGWQTAPPYVAAKGGVHALTRALAVELAPSGITVNTVAPSAVLTDRIRRLRDDAELEATAASIPLGRYQTPEEVAAWIVFLASPEAGFMTGQTVSVNGGRFMA